MSVSLSQTLPPSARGEFLRKAKESKLEAAKYNLDDYPVDMVVRCQTASRCHLATNEVKSRKKMHARRRRIMMEILQTETDYVDNLHALVKHFLTPLAKDSSYASILGPKLQQEFAFVLPGVEMILGFHTTLLAALNATDSSKPSFLIGGVFLDVVMYFRSYSQYVNHYQVIVQLLAGRKQDTALQKAFAGLKPSALGKGLKDYMIMPVQRIPRYSLLLFDMLRNTWKGHLDLTPLSMAYQKVLDIAHNIENMSADAVSIERVFDLASSFTQNGGPFKLVVPHRRFIASAECLCTLPSRNIVMKSLQVFLFNDIIIWAKCKKDNKFSVQHSLRTLMIANVCMTDVFPESGAEFIELETMDSEVLRLMMAEKNEEWYNNLQLTKNNEKAWLPHRTSRDVSTTARYLAVGNAAAHAAHTSPLVKDIAKEREKKKGKKLAYAFGSLRQRKSSKVDDGETWMEKAKGKAKQFNAKMYSTDADSGSGVRFPSVKPKSKSAMVVTQETPLAEVQAVNLGSLDLSTLKEAEGAKKNRPRSSRSTRDKVEPKAYKRSVSDRYDRDKFVFKRDEGKDKDKKSKRRKASKDLDSLISPRQPSRSKSSNDDTEDSEILVALREDNGKARAGKKKRHRKVVSSDMGREQSRLRLSPSRASAAADSDSDTEEESSRSSKSKSKKKGRHRKKASNEEEASIKFAKSMSLTHMSSPREDTIQHEEPRERRTRTRKRSKVIGEDLDTKSAPTIRSSTSRSPRSPRSPSVSPLLQAATSPSLLPASEPVLSSYETAVDVSKQERARQARAKLRAAQRDSEISFVDKEDHTVALLKRRHERTLTAESIDPVAATPELNRAATSALSPPSPVGKTTPRPASLRLAPVEEDMSSSVDSILRDSEESLPYIQGAGGRRPRFDSDIDPAQVDSMKNAIKEKERERQSETQSNLQAKRASFSSGGWSDEDVQPKRASRVPTPSPLPERERCDIMQVPKTPTRESPVSSPFSESRRHRRGHSIGGSVRKSIVRASPGHSRRLSGSSTSDMPDKDDFALCVRNESVSRLVDVFTAAQEALVDKSPVSSPAVRRKGGASPSADSKSSMDSPQQIRKDVDMSHVVSRAGSSGSQDSPRKVVLVDVPARERSGDRSRSSSPCLSYHGTPISPRRVKPMSPRTTSASQLSPRTEGQSSRSSNEENRGRWRKLSEAGKPGGVAEASMKRSQTVVEPMVSESPPVRCTPAQFTRHDSLQQMTTVSNLLSQFRALEVEETSGVSEGDSDLSVSQTEVKRKEEDEKEDSETSKPNNLASSVDSDADSEAVPLFGAAGRKPPMRTSSANTMDECNFTSVSNILESLLQQGVIDPAVARLVSGEDFQTTK